MNIKAKFKVDVLLDSKSTPSNPDQSFEQTVVLSPVISGSEENKSFSKYTPSGELRMHITNPNVKGFFAVGKEYYLDIAPAE